MASLQHFVYESGFITIAVLACLSFYFILTLWVFFYKYVAIRTSILKEQRALEALMAGNTSMLSVQLFESTGRFSKELLFIWKNQVLQHSTTGLVLLSIVASTAPFIGLFGTVVEILDAFGRLGTQVSFDVIAPVISKALVATAAGILTAIPAYSFFLILKRKVYDLSVCVQMQIDFLIAKEG
ncbi:MotA/TolQ/ExbB proton channel family protein [Helicobacter baculiformis]|uniref:MotA/TolQ/ExbB proton channel family protein n=1 Tax=Helicobacter baculiformis TaxID=427351 RepID=A0ABV7ZH53_9HELI|nr:MotA/TolQ/ExbB proton channel family protein [Helicobacter baculiformis]